MTKSLASPDTFQGSRCNNIAGKMTQRSFRKHRRSGMLSEVRECFDSIPDPVRLPRHHPVWLPDDGAWSVQLEDDVAAKF